MSPFVGRACRALFHCLTCWVAQLGKSLRQLFAAAVLLFVLLFVLLSSPVHISMLHMSALHSHVYLLIAPFHPFLFLHSSAIIPGACRLHWRALSSRLHWSHILGWSNESEFQGSNCWFVTSVEGRMYRQSNILMSVLGLICCFIDWLAVLLISTLSLSIAFLVFVGAACSASKVCLTAFREILNSLSKISWVLFSNTLIYCFFALVLRVAENQSLPQFLAIKSRSTERKSLDAVLFFCLILF